MAESDFRVVVHKNEQGAEGKASAVRHVAARALCTLLLVTPLCNADSVAGALQVMVVRRNMTMAKFKKQAGKKLGTKPKKVFLVSGAEISDVDEMQNDDMLYISQGEPYYKNPGACAALRAAQALPCQRYERLRNCALKPALRGAGSARCRIATPLIERCASPCCTHLWDESCLECRAVSDVAATHHSKSKSPPCSSFFAQGPALGARRRSTYRC